jgi:hypothetical protein
MAELMKRLNIRYFAGTEELNSSDVINSEGYQLWMTYPEGFLPEYIQSIASDKDTDDNRLHIDLDDYSVSN